MKDSNEVVQEFNEIVNMTSSELEKWLKSDDSRSAGWPKEDEGGESVGHDSGRKIVDILKSNPDKDPEKYTDDQISHMRKVVSYCKRHLAQEKKMIDTKSTEEVKESKSYASLKNWGHDPLKGEDGGDDGDNEDAEADGDTQENTDDQQTGNKRKKDTGAQAGANKKRETRQGKASTNGSKKKQDDEDEDEDDGDDEANGEDEDDDKEEGDDDGDDSGKKPKKGPKPGDKVSWAWGGGHPEGKVLDVKGDTTTVTTKRGSKVSRHGDPEDPAVVLDTGKSKAIKHNHELD